MRCAIPVSILCANRLLLTYQKRYLCVSSQKKEQENLIEQYKYIQRIARNKDDLIQHLVSNIVYEDDSIIGISKPAGVPMKVEKTAVNDPRIIDVVSLFQTLPDLREYFRCPEMNVALSLPRLISGVVLFGKTESAAKLLNNCLYASYSLGELHQQFRLICLGIPKKTNQPGPQKLFVKEEIDSSGKKHYIQVNEASKKKRSEGSISLTKFNMEVILQSRAGVKCCFIELMANSCRWNCCELFMINNMAMILGDHTHSGKLVPLLGRLVAANPELGDTGPQILEKSVLEALELHGDEETRSTIPLHLHRSRVTIKKYPTKKSNPIVIKCAVPDYFNNVMQRLKLI